jgi:hypothetical protein
MNKILCFGDGYAANHIWPEWPAMIRALYPEVQHENFGQIGAGNEFITSAIVQAHIASPDAFFLVQWALPQRFDKLLQDDSWHATIENDPVYHFNRVSLGEQTWWLSSSSKQDLVQQYHKVYVQNKQANNRSYNFKYLVENLLRSQAIFFTLEQLIFFADAERFQQIRQKEVQPSPAVHMTWVEEKILPKMPYQPDPARLYELKKRIKQHKWHAYDPDREEIWARMSLF